jgi:hypothetical protein
MYVFQPEPLWALSRAEATEKGANGAAPFDLTGSPMDRSTLALQSAHPKVSVWETAKEPAGGRAPGGRIHDHFVWKGGRNVTTVPSGAPAE